MEADLSLTKKASRLIAAIANGIASGDTLVRDKAVSRGLRASSFPERWAQQAYSALEFSNDITDNIFCIEEFSTPLAQAREAFDGIHYPQFSADVEAVVQYGRQQEKVEAARAIKQAVENGEDAPDDALSIISGRGKTTSRRSLLDARRFSSATPPDKPLPVFRLGRSIMGTPGNLIVVASQAKGGKTGFLSACVAAAFGMSGDTLSVTSENLGGFAVVHFDSEQSKSDHFDVIKTSLRRVGLDREPEWLRSYSLADVPEERNLDLIEEELNQARLDCGGIHSVFIDGIADFVRDPNDPLESFSAVGRLHALALGFNTVILCVLHENPNSETGKTRGHLGSQLERKAETNLRLDKDGAGVTTVYSTRARHAMIPKLDGPRFRWCMEERMHVSAVTSRNERDEQDTVQLRELLDEVLPHGKSLRYAELETAIMSSRSCSGRTAQRKISALRGKNLINVSCGQFRAA